MNYHKYTEEEIRFLREYAPGHSYKEIARAFSEKFPPGVSVGMISGCMKRYGIQNGLDGRFSKGHEPANKGKHIQVTGRMAETQFKKGHTPKNHRPVGSVSVRHSYTGKKPYVWEKVAEPDVWRMKHVVEWEKANGPVPDGMIVIFADGDTLNTDISNLVLISRSQNAVMNRWNIKGHDREHMEAAANVATLKSQIAKQKRKRKKKKEVRK
jgi:hypothetical protein